MERTLDHQEKDRIKRVLGYIVSELDPERTADVSRRSAVVTAWLEGAYLYDRLREFPINEKLLRSTGPDHEFFDWICHVKFKDVDELCNSIIDYAGAVVEDKERYDANYLWLDELRWENCDYRVTFNYLVLTYFNSFIPEYATWKLAQALKGDIE